MLKIFLTGDNHIGLKYASYSMAQTIIANRINAFKNMVNVANEEECNIFVIAGDMFENTYSISKRDVKTILDMLSHFKGTVAILPGNHDYYDRDLKLWKYFKDLMHSYDNIMPMNEYKPYHIAFENSKIKLYPALCTTMHSVNGQNNLGWIKNEDIDTDECYNIGVAHGALKGETIDTEGEYFLMKRSELESIPMDIWLLGHTHVPFPKNITKNLELTNERIFNAGTHVQTHYKCNTKGECFIIEIDENKNVRAKKIISGNMYFYRQNVVINSGSLKTKLEDALSNIPYNSVVDLVISGAISPDEYENRHFIIKNALSGFIESTYNEYGLSKLISQELIESEFPETSFSARLLTELLTEPKEAQLTYELLKSLKGRQTK